ncbi:hypothetical protein J3459_010374 [Metarhizium acridum]|nr:hypothetical protein J3459_010374 [Metarhizium acridum]
MLGPDEAINDKMPLVEQGVDSLVAIEIRTWFMKELDVDIPVVKILSASLTVAALVTDAVAKLPPSLLRNPAVQSSPPVFTQFMPRPQNENDDGTLHVASHSVTSSQTGLSTPDTQPSLPK